MGTKVEKISGKERENSTKEDGPDREEEVIGSNLGRIVEGGSYGT